LALLDGEIAESARFLLLNCQKKQKSSGLLRISWHCATFSGPRKITLPVKF